MTINFKIIFILAFLCLFFTNYKHIFGGNKDTFTIGTEASAYYQKPIINRILNKIYPNKKIIWENTNKCDLICKGSFPSEEPNWNKKKLPYIYCGSERFLPPKSLYHTKYLILNSFNDINNLLKYSNNNKNFKNTDTYTYLPWCINYFNKFIKSLNKFNKSFKNIKLNEKEYFCVYCFRNPINYREEFYNKLVEKTKNTDKKCIAIGKNHGNHPETLIKLEKKHKESKYNNRITDDAKFEYYKKSIFCICMENIIDSSPTEKIIEAIHNRSIPVFYGTSCDLFNKDAYIDVNDFENLDKCIDYIVNMSDTDIEKMLNTNPFNQNNDLWYYFDDTKECKMLNHHCKLVKNILN